MLFRDSADLRDNDKITTLEWLQIIAFLVGSEIIHGVRRVMKRGRIVARDERFTTHTRKP
jgi:hypothetical protein